MSCTTYVEATFEAAHSLPDGFGHATVHGHSYWVRCYFEQGKSVNVLKRLVEAAVSHLDHVLLNDVLAVEPTMENIAEFLAERTHAVRVRVWRPSLQCGAEYARD